MKHTFRAVHEGRGGYVEYSDGQHSVKLDMEMMATGPAFVVYVPELEPELSRKVIQKLDAWRFWTGRHWSIHLPSGELLPARPLVRRVPWSKVSVGMVGACAGLLLTLLACLLPGELVLFRDLIFLPAALFDWFFLLGDTGSPQQHESNVFRYACLFNSLAGGILSVVGSILATPLRRRMA